MPGFVWKPTSEKDGNAVALFPAGSATPPNIYIISPSGEIIQGTYAGNTDGNRPTYRFPDNGQSYGNNFTLIGPNGQALGISNGAQRYDDANPPVVIENEQQSAEFGQTGQVQQSSGGGNQGGGGGTTPQTSQTNLQTDGEGSTGNRLEDRLGGGRKFPGGSAGNAEAGDGATQEGGGGEGGGTGTGNNIGFEGSQGFAFPQSDFSSLTFAPINPTFVPPTPVVDPIQRTEEVGDFNRLQNQVNLGIGSQNALGLTQLEFDGLQLFNRQARELQQEGVAQENVFNQGQFAQANKFNRGQIPASNAFNRGELTEANAFNQEQRLSQLETALPGASDTINRQIERGTQLAEGRFVTDAEDRAFEVAARSASADGTIARGFGDDSVFGKRSSELLSAQQRLQVSQVGEQTLNRFLTLGANLKFDQPIKQNPVLDQPLQFQPQQTRTSQDVRGAPSIPASQLAVQQQQQLNELSTITPTQAIAFDINQNQFQSGVDKFNSQLDFNSQQFNSTTGLQVDLEKLYADVFNSQQEAGAINLGIQTGITQDQFNQQVQAGQQSALIGAAGNILGAGLGFLLDRYGKDGEGKGTISTGSGETGPQGTPPSTTGGGAPNTSGTETVIPQSQEIDAPASSPTVTYDPETGEFTLGDEFGEDSGSDGFGGGYSVGGSSGGGGGSVERLGGANNDTTTATQVTRALGGDVAAREDLNNRLSKSDNGFVATSDGGGSAAGGTGVEGGSTTDTAGNTLAFLNNAYNYQQEYDDLSDNEKAAGAAQLTAGALLVAGQISGPVGAAIIGFADLALTVANWEDYSDSEKASIAVKYSGLSIESQGGFDYNIGNLIDSAGKVFGFSTATLLEDAFGSNKPRDQKIRDRMRQFGAEKSLFVLPDREFAEANGVKEGSHQVQLADGTYYDVGVDGNARLENYGTNVDGEDTRRAADIDWSDPRTSETVGMLNPFLDIVYGEFGVKLMGQMTNAATSNNNTLSGTKENIKAFVESTGLTYEVGINVLKRHYEQGKLTTDVYYAYLNGWNGLMLSDGVSQEIVV